MFIGPHPREYEVWEITVQESMRPFTYEKVRLIATLTHKVVTHMYEQCLKHIHLGDGIIWVIGKEWHGFLEIEYRTFVLIEGFHP